MDEVNLEIGKKIRIFRKKQNMTLDALAAAIYKSKATVSKYEKGEITIDISTLYEVANALDVHIEQLLYSQPVRQNPDLLGKVPPFFKGLSNFYGYWYDGRNNSILRMLFDVSPSDMPHQQKIMMYMNFDDYEHYPICENTYEGIIEHFDALSIMQLANKHLPLEKASIQILATSLDFTYKWGLWQGLSTRPLMPVATKMLVCQERMKEDEELISRLKISKEDIRLLKQYNMLTVL
ncbi:MAG: helix-turn-helix transcriptional regulator [Mogibacterium sp.]|nr:helix-turn-helix transcriptional regulator [Mogibacterium sp.]